MPLPIFLYALWALWPIAAYPGGKLFAPLVAIIGLCAIPRFVTTKLELPALIGLVFIGWICVTALWSPANEGLFSGNLLEENFAVEASYIRFAFTAIGCFLFVWLVLKAPSETFSHVPVWMVAGILFHILIVLYMAINRDDMLASRGDFLVPTGQSMGRNANLLAMGVPLLLGALALHGKLLQGLLAGAGLLVFVSFLALWLDGLAAILAFILGGVFLAALRVWPRSGFRVLFNLIAFGLLSAPALAFGLARLAPVLAGTVPLTAQQRIIIWQASLERILEKPLFGHGVNAAPTWTERYTSRPDLLELLSPELINHRIIPNHPHSMALQLWAETGLIGILLAAGLLVMAGRTLPEPRALSPAVKIASAGLLGAAMAYFLVSYSVWDESFWASIAIILSGIIVLHRRAAP